MAKDGQACFHRRLFADPVKPQRCTTEPVKPLDSINKDVWCQTIANDIRLGIRALNHKVRVRVRIRVGNRIGAQAIGFMVYRYTIIYKRIINSMK